jgi:outer membrane cobalamin receptor
MSNPRPHSRAALFLAQTEKVVVTGFRASLRNAQNIKKNATELIDAIVAEDIGKLPDNNISQALQRIPGVQITRNHGEGSGTPSAA